MPLTVATFNTHDAIGTDGVRDISRIARTVEETGADIVALQEVSGPGDEPGTRPDHFAALTRSFGGYAVEGPAMQNRERRYGNLLLSRWPLTDWRVADLAYPAREPRNAIMATVDLPEGPLRVVASHFGLFHRERRAQARLIGDLAAEGGDMATVILGDFNDWLPLSPVVRLLSRSLGQHIGAVRRLPTFPSRLPVLALDRILVNDRVRLRGVRVPGTPLARTASDHRPLTAHIEIVPTGG
ncbi:MAG: endonuclease/exonuclease/phosphatase family protein [Thalassobaculum sp.]